MSARTISASVLDARFKMLRALGIISGPIIPRPLAFPATAVDPQNLTGRATDAGPGTPTVPLRTVKELNRRLRTTVAQPLTIELLSKQNILTDEPLTFDETVTTDTTLELLVVGTPIVLHTGTFTGTVTQNPTTNTFQEVSDTAFDFTTLAFGGRALFINDTTSNTIADISTVVDLHTVGTGQPDGVGFAPADTYQVLVMPDLVVSDLRPVGTIGIVAFQNVSLFCLSTQPRFPQALVSLLECGTHFPLPGGAGEIIAQTCELGMPVDGNPGNFLPSLLDLPSTPGGVVQILGGLLHAPNAATSPFSWSGDVVTGNNPQCVACGPIIGLGAIQSSAGSLSISGDGGNGLAVFGAAGEALLTQLPGTGLLVEGLLWGANNNVAAHILQLGNAEALFDLTATVTPVATGTTLNGFLLGELTGVADAYDPVAGKYNVGIASTWTNFNTPVAGGGFGGNAHNLNVNAHLVQQAT